MSQAQIETHRDIYNSLRARGLRGGECLRIDGTTYEHAGCILKTWEDAMSSPDTPTVARYRLTRETSMWFAIGKAA